jgi:acyl carrier protein
MKLEEILGSILEVSPMELGDHSGQQTLQSWSSFAHINIILALENVYGVSFTTKEIQAVKSIGEIRQLLRDKGAPVI